MTARDPSEASILARLRRQPGEEPLCASRATGWMTRSEFIGSLEVLDSEADQCAGARVALKLRTPLLLAQALTRLDGAAASLLLIPPSTDAEVEAGFLRSAEIQVVLEESQETPGRVLLRKTGLPGSDGLAVKRGGEDRTIASEWLIPTSGTTSTPKLVSHSLASLTDRVKSSPSAAKYTWGLIFDLNRFAGLQVFFQAVLGASRIVFPRHASSLDEALEDFTEYGVNSLSASPTLWRKILMSPASADLALSQVSLGGEIADQQSLDALARRFPQARISHIYASTEAGAGFSVSDGKEGFPLSYLSDPPAGVKLKLDAGGGLRLWKEKTASRYLSAEGAIADAEGYVETGDLVELRGDRCVFLGRANGAINVGGNKVQPEEVERVIRELAEVADVSVYAKKNPISGALVAASVVLRSGAAEPAAIRAKIRAHCTARLESYKVPAFVGFCENLQVTAAGKVLRAQEGRDSGPQGDRNDR